MKRQKIHLWFPNLFDFKGGIQVYLQDVLKVIYQQSPGCSLTVYNKLDRHSDSHTLNFKNIKFYWSGHISPLWNTFHFTVNLILGALTQFPQLIICGHLNFAPVAYLLNKLLGIPYWIFVYGVDAWAVEDPLKKKALQGAEKIISISGYTRDRLLQEQNLDPTKIFLLPVTFNANRFHISPKPNYLLKRYHLTADQPVILTVSRLATQDGYKGYDQIIQALPRIKEVFPKIHYLIVGKGDDQLRIEQEIQRLNLNHHVTLAGFIPDEEISDHYNLCDVFAMPSKGEGFGIVYLEALACGKPTLGGNKDGAIDALNSGKLGALVDPDQVEQIAETLIQILSRSYPNTLLYQPESLRQNVIEIFGFERFQKTLNNLIQSKLKLQL